MSNNHKQWYVIHVFSGLEQQVKKMLQERIARYNMQERFGEILVPTEEVIEIREGKKRKSERKFFPGYILTHMEMDDETWHLVKSTPKILGFIGGSGDKPVPIMDSEAQKILNQIQEMAAQPKPKIPFQPGEVVRVINGPFADFNGVVEEVNYEKSKLRVAVLIFGRSTPVELEFRQVEKNSTNS
ncbi:transcription termination/antitermination protein NusG [Candidatus Nitrosacidococcus tergens]|uniref:Transcription termination/antitermination protein NusG n=2 Tax=Candidatus Nitrosacidococcus tergens TaxID=553981 RepID=A0A7G1Q840_9GAMM|nr:transcription antitermination protein [Candidatus Nitrosacidococcus tergens]